MRATYITISIIFLFWSCESKNLKSTRYLNKARINYTNKEFSKADSNCSLAITLDSTNISALILKSEIKTELKNFSAAIDILKSALKNGKLKDSIFYFLAGNYFNLAWEIQLKEEKNINLEKPYWDLARKYYDSAITLNPYFYKAYVNKAKVLHNLDEYSEAITIINLANNLDNLKPFFIISSLTYIAYCYIINSASSLTYTNLHNHGRKR